MGADQRLAGKRVTPHAHEEGIPACEIWGGDDDLVSTKRDAITQPPAGRPITSVEAMERCGNRRPRVERLVSAWNQGVCADAESDGEADDPLIGVSAEPKKRPRTRLTDEEVDAMRTARAQGISVKAVARQFGVHRGTVWAKTR